ncbi:MAG: DUF305 domain-containing protein, partial [Thermomicrobiales bacterium]
ATLVALAAFVLGWSWLNRPPGDDSLEAGFARDMIVHHDQAVAMALLIRDRTADPAITTLATDILLTQQNQIGQMLGWLHVWGLPATGKALPMAWMGHPTSGRMPGMASAEELANLARLSGEAADAEFLRLMIRHHQGGIPMAEAAWQGSGNQPVRDLAQSIVTTQEAEIAVMEELLREKEGRLKQRTGASGS